MFETSSFFVFMSYLKQSVHANTGRGTSQVLGEGTHCVCGRDDAIDTAVLLVPVAGEGEVGSFLMAWSKYMN